MNKVVLSYSGGLETTVAIHWLTHQRGMRVIALCVNVGQGRDLDEVADRANHAGAIAAHVVDERQPFVRRFCWKSLRASAKYEGVYLLSAALSRPLIATAMVRTAHSEGARLVAHGSPTKGNDQFRIECSVAALDPTIQVIGVVREWEMLTRDDVMEYAEKHNLQIDNFARDPYTHDFNLWGARCSGGDLLDLTVPAPEAAYSTTVNPMSGPDVPEDVTVGFNKGDPVSINGHKMHSVELLVELNRIGARHGIGRLDLIENNLMGFKTREVYEAPGAAILHSAHDALERLVLDKGMLNLKRYLSNVYADVVYNGLWFSTMRG